MRTAIFIVNYNMPERSDALWKYLHENTKANIDIYTIDNGSDICKPPIHTNVWISKNVQTTRGWLYGLHQADQSGIKYDAYMFLITSMQFIPESKDVVSSMIEVFDNPKAVGVHASLSEGSTTAWEHLKNRGTNSLRRTWFIDNVCCIYRADWFNNIGRFDFWLKYAYGIDLETCYKSRKQGMELYVDDRIQIEKISNIGYSMQRMNMGSDTRQKLAMANMEKVLSRKYGDDWYWKMTKEGVTDDLI